MTVKRYSHFITKEWPERNALLELANTIVLVQLLAHAIARQVHGLEDVEEQ